MSEEGKFWLGIYSLATIALVVLILSISRYYYLQDQFVVEMVANGEDPIAASCAMADSYGRNPTCVAYITGVAK